MRALLYVFVVLGFLVSNCTGAETDSEQAKEPKTPEEIKSFINGLSDEGLKQVVYGLVVRLSSLESHCQRAWDNEVPPPPSLNHTTSSNNYGPITPAFQASTRANTDWPALPARYPPRRPQLNQWPSVQIDGKHFYLVPAAYFSNTQPETFPTSVPTP